MNGAGGAPRPAPARRPARRRRPRSGFTLLEMLVVMLLTAIVAAIALPGYHRILQRAHRAEARTALLRAAHWLEREATARGLYPEGALPASLGISDGKRYRILRQPPENAAHAGLRFVLHAVPQGAQATDACGTLTLKDTGEHGATGPDAAAANCWPG
ncbi:type IV pilin protein [Variovorax sp.]|uniref:type IV pilin protein n=1 Tax=Variovorax sp. TaxID=1871043 RepID=UPI002D2416BD|nr:type IV pilin protein [Variovorax sp.]HYP83763.1 type IV pilin protein [Variovorax sp.]